MFVRNVAALCVGAVLAWPGAARAQESDESVRAKVIALNSITGDKAVEAKVRELRKDKPLLKKMVTDAVALVKEKEKDKDLPLTYNAAYVLAVDAHLIQDFENAEVLYKVCIEHAFNLRSAQKQAEVFNKLINLFQRQKKYDEAMLVCEKFLKLEADDTIERVKPLILDEMIQILAKQKKFDKAMEITEKVLEENEGSWYFLHRKADLLRDQGKSEEALKTYEHVLELLGDAGMKDADKERYTHYCKYVMSGIYVDLKQLDKGIEILEELLKEKPDNATYNNDLGYLLADNDKRLDEAEQMIRKALDLERGARKKLKESGDLDEESDKDNAAYVDSLAWVYFKQKKYAEARDLMLEVVKDEDSQHVEIYDHLAQIYMALGQKADAVKTWKKALTLDNVTHRDDARKEAVKKRLEAATK